MREKRKFSPEERLAILQEGEREWQTETCRKYKLVPSLYQRWKQKYLQKGVAGLKPSYKRIDPEKRALEEENEMLKKVVARQALELEIKSELLKKTPIQIRRK